MKIPLAIGFRRVSPVVQRLQYVAFAVQPIVPADGKFIAITVSDDGTVYILFELSVPAADGQDKQYILTGTSYLD